MMQPQQNSQVPAGLQALFVLQDPKVQQALNVLKQQAAPAAQGPQGEPTPTVSGQVLQSFSPPQPQMPPGMPPGMPPQEPPQGPDMAGMAQNAATGSNIQAQQQAQAQEALMKQLMMQQQAQAQQPVMAASGGIASLNARNMEDFADGGVVGYAEGGIPFGEATPLSPEAEEWLQQREKIKAAAEELAKREKATKAAQQLARARPEILRPLLQSLVESAKSGPAAVVGGVGSLLSKFAASQMEASPELRQAYENPMLGAMDPEGSMAAAILSQPTTPATADNTNTPAAQPAKFDLQGDPANIINQLTGVLRNNQSLSEADRTAIAQEIQKQYIKIGAQPTPPVPMELQGRSPYASPINSTQSAESPYKVPGEGLYQDVLNRISQLQGPSARTEEDIQKQREAAYERRGLPNLRQAAEDRIRQTTAFDEESRRQMAEANKASMQNAWASGILQPGARNLAEMFGGAARGMIGEEGRQAQAAIAQRAIARSQLLLDNQIREALDKADIAAANGDLVTEQAEKTKAQEFALKKQELQIGAMTARSKEEAQFGTQMDVARLNAEQREQAAALRAIVQQQGQQIRAGGKSMTYNEASDNVQKMMESPAGFMEVSSIKAAARKEGRPEPTLSEIKEILVQRELRAAGALPAGGQTPPSAGQPMYARNPTTNERIMSTDGGTTWKSVQ